MKTNLDKFVEELRDKLKNHKDYSEDEIIRFIYIALGKKIVFDVNWLFGNDFTRSSIYYKEDTPELVDDFKHDEKWVLICKGIAYALSYVGTQLGINIETVQEQPNQWNPYPHVYNKVTKKDGSEYHIDLYGDLPNIHMNNRTVYFGFTEYIAPRVFNRKQLEEMDHRIGYISNTKPYTDDYHDLLKDWISRIDSIHDKIRLILENPSPYMEFNLEYDERKKILLIFQLLFLTY